MQGDPPTSSLPMDARVQNANHESSGNGIALHKTQGADERSGIETHVPPTIQSDGHEMPSPIPATQNTKYTEANL